MPDTAPIRPQRRRRPRAAAGAEHGVLLDAYHALRRIPPIADAPLNRLTQALTELEECVAGLPAHSATGLLVCLRVLWAALDHTDTSLSLPPGPDANLIHRLVWGTLLDAERRTDYGAGEAAPTISINNLMGFISRMG